MRQQGNSVDDDEPRAYGIEISDTADAEADAIFLWIGAHNPERAAIWYRELHRIYDGLRLFPHRNAAVEHRSDVRRELHGPYRILYRIIEPEQAGEEGVVRILRIIHGSRQREGIG